MPDTRSMMKAPFVWFGGKRRVAPQVRVYIDKNDWWVGAYSGPHHWYVCPLPCLVIRWRRHGSEGDVPGHMVFRDCPSCGKNDDHFCESEPYPPVQIGVRLRP
jgi:hypothetical protein